MSVAPPATRAATSLFPAGAGRWTGTTTTTASSWFRRAGPVLLIVGSAWSGALGTLFGVTITGDRVLGLAALALLVVLGVGGQLRWTGVHTASAVFVGAQVLTTTANAAGWPQGLKFVTVYVLGFACFALAVECARGADGRRWMRTVWIAVAVLMSVVGTVMADLSNVYQQPLWGTGAAQLVFSHTPSARLLFGAKVAFNEWNLFSSFLLIPFTLGLWAWRRETARQGLLVAALGAMMFGLVSGITRAAWLSMTGLIALWWKLRRPRRRQVAALGLMLAGAFLVQALSLGGSPLWARFFEQRSNIDHRLAINRVTFQSWAGHPGPDWADSGLSVLTLLLGRGAGSVNHLSVVLPEARLERVWTGNVVLFVLHDSGLVGLATLLGLVVVVLRRAARAIQRDAGGATSSFIVPLLASGGALCFAYQFTHGLWLMYPYVYLGFLTAVTETGSDDA